MRMSFPMKLRWLLILPITLLAFGCLGRPMLAQTQPALVMQDPTRPESQPPLDIDRDPVPSIDHAAVSAAASAAKPASAPQNPLEVQKGQNGMYVLHANVDEVLLDCAVIDSKGRTVTGLTQKDFRVWEDGVPQVINAFQHQDQPVSMGLVIDNSGSMRDKRTAVNAAAFHLLRASNPKDSAFVVNFSDRAYLDQGFTSNLTALDRGIDRFDSHGTTALYDAVAASADELAKYGKHREQVLLIITDGADNASHLDLQQTIRRVQALGGPVVYCIGILYDSNKEEAGEARNALELLSQQTGGVAYFPKSLSDVDRIAAEIAQDIRNQYTIAYRSTKPFRLGGYRFVHVEARSPSGERLTVRTRHGYYANAANSETAEDTQ